MVNKEELRMLCKKLNLHHLSRIDSFDIKIKDKEEYLKYLLEYEIEERKKSVKKKNKTRSNLPTINPKLKFDGITDWNIEDLKNLEWLRNNQNLIIVGKCGTGKTTIAVNVALTAIEEEYSVYYIKIDELLYSLNNLSDNKSKIINKKMVEADLIIIDEMMYLPTTSEDVVRLYKCIMTLNDARSFIFITNRRLETWKEMIDDKYLMETFIARLINGSRQILTK